MTYGIAIALLILVKIILVKWSIKNNKLAKEQRIEGLRLLRESTEYGLRITAWLKEHIDELQNRPIETLNQKELTDMIEEDQKLYDKILKFYPDYECMPPTELHRHLIEIAECKHKHVH